MTPSTPSGTSSRRASRSARPETPPLATTGRSVRRQTSRSSSTLGPRSMPSLTTSVTTYRAQPSASRRARASQRSPPSWVHPRAASVVPRTSRPTAIRSPNSAIAERVQSGSSRAAVPRLTRAQPVARAVRRLASSRMPPESSTRTSRVRTTPARSSRLEPRPKAASRSTRWIHSAPARAQARAAASGSPYDVSLPTSPWTRRTAWPSATSTAGSSCRRGASVTEFSFAGGGLVRARQLVPRRHIPRSQRAHPVLQQVGARVAALLGVELGRGQRSVLDPGHEPHAVLAPRDARRLEVGEPTVPWLELPALHGVGVHEVEALPLHAGEQGGARGRVDGVPTHVRHDVGRQPLHGAGPLPQPGPGPGEGGLGGALEEHLVAHADAEDRSAAGQPASHQLGGSHRLEADHAGGEVSDSGDQQAVAPQHGRAVARQLDLRAHPLERAHGRADVSGAVVEDDDPGSGRGRAHRSSSSWAARRASVWAKASKRATTVPSGSTRSAPGRSAARTAPSGRPGPRPPRGPGSRRATPPPPRP